MNRLGGTIAEWCRATPDAAAATDGRAAMVISRDRRTGGVGQGHAGTAARRAFRLRPSRHRELYRATALARARQRRRSGRPGRGGGGGAPRRPADSGGPAAARRSGRRRRLDRRRDPGGARGACSTFSGDFAAHPPAPARGAVLDGRDIGSVVCPDADVEAFRHRQRCESARDAGSKSCGQRGAAAIYERVLQDMRERDARDGGRRAAPLAAAADAVDHRYDGARRRCGACERRPRLMRARSRSR